MEPPKYRLTLSEAESGILLEVWEFTTEQDVPHDLEQEIRRNMEANTALRKDM